PVAAPDRYDVALRLDLDEREAEHAARGEPEDLEVPLGHPPSSPGSRSRSSDSHGGWSPVGAGSPVELPFLRPILIRCPSWAGAAGAGRETGGTSSASSSMTSCEHPVRRW